MAMFVQTVTAAEVLAGLTTDSTKWAGTDLARLESAVPFSMLDVWGVPIESVTLDSGASDATLPSLAIPNLTGVTIKAAYLMLYIRWAYETAGADTYIQNDQYIQIDDQSGTGYTNAITLKNQVVNCGNGERVYNIRQFGSHDISSRINFNETSPVKWASGKANGDDLILRNVNVGVRLML